jgi:hypothetical protein
MEVEPKKLKRIRQCVVSQIQIDNSNFPAIKLINCQYNNSSRFIPRLAYALEVVSSLPL